MKTFAILLATIVAVLAQALFIGLNGLTLLSIPITLYLGLEVLEHLSEPESDENPEQPNI